MTLQYILFARISNDIRQLKFESLWEAHVAASQLITKKNGWPERITYGGFEISSEHELNEFDHKFHKIMHMKKNWKALDNYRLKVLREAREKIMPK